MGNSKGHKLSDYVKLNKKTDKRTKKYKNKKKSSSFSLYADTKLKAPDPWTTEGYVQ